MLRRLTEYWTRGWVVSRPLPREFGGVRVYVSPDAQLRLLLPGARGFDPQLLALAATHVDERSVVWDVGANCGVFAVAAAARARSGRVVAVEPDIWLAGLIRRTIRRNQRRLGEVEVLPAAMADRAGVERFAIAERGRAANSLARVGDREVAGGVREQVLVPTLTLDLLLERGPPPTVVKIDVERAEQIVLEGGRRMLSEARPVVHVEVGAESQSAVSNLLHAHGYSLFDARDGGDLNEPVPACVWETLAIPEEQVAAVRSRIGGGSRG